MPILNGHEKLEQLERIVRSPQLHNSEALCHLLRYLTKRAVDHPDSAPKEYQIATEVFGRPEDFDPRLDSTVRVQTSRLRTKLAEYYAGPGAHDSVVIEIPRGAYSVLFHEQTASQAPPPPPPPPVAPASRRWIWLALGALIGGVAVWILSIGLQRPDPVSKAAVPLATQAFWRDYAEGSDSPLVIFSNAEFVGRPETGLRYFQKGTDDPAQIQDFYTGVGEVLAVRELDKLFERLGRKFIVKRGRLLNWDDTRNRDLVFIGSPSENLSLRDLPVQHEFVFRSLEEAHPRKGDLAIVNLKPQAGEEAVYVASKGLPLTEDYALVELMPGLSKEQTILLLAGTTTFGTQAAAEFVCRDENLGDLLFRLNGDRSHQVGPFAAVLQVKINGGVPVGTKIVALRPFKR